MALKNLSRALETTSRILHDVEFVFIDNVFDETLTVTAHKVILSIASDVFEAQFYGNIQEPSDRINISDASFKAFQMMVEYIYNREHAWEKEELSFLAEMYYLGEKYHLDDLKEEILDSVAKHYVNRSNLLEVAILAEKQAQPHPELSKRLYTIAAMFLKTSFNGDIKEVLKLFSEVKADPSDATNSFILHKLMSTLNDIRQICLNCKTIPCLSNSEVTRHRFVAGARIRIVQGKHFHPGIDPYAITERLSKSKPNKFIIKKATGYISCYFGKGSYTYVCCNIR